MRVSIDIAPQLVSDLAAFVGRETLTPDELAALVADTILEKASQFVERRADARRAEVLEQIRLAAEARKAEIAAGVTVTPDENPA